jgi:hypothetical protein
VFTLEVCVDNRCVYVANQPSSEEAFITARHIASNGLRISQQDGAFTYYPAHAIQKLRAYPAAAEVVSEG